MPLVIPPGFAHVDIAIRHTLYVREAHCTLGLELAAGISDPVDLANEMMSILALDMNNVLDTEAEFRSVTVSIGQDGGEPVVGVNTNGVATGGAGQVSPPPNVALLVHKRTALGGRKNRGRFSWPWMIADGDVDEIGGILAVTVAARQATFDAFLTSITGHPDITNMVILHDSSKYTTTRPSPTVKTVTRTTVTTPAPTVVTSLTVDPRVGTQRRRMGR